LSADVAELRSDTEEEGVLLGKRLLLVGGLGAAGGCLSGHIGVGNLRNGSEEEDDSKDEDEDGNALIRI
jgi:hypothetical protein